MDKKYIPIVLFLCLLSYIGCEKTENNQSIEVISILDTTYATIGDIVHLDVNVFHTKDRPVLIQPLEIAENIEIRSTQTTRDENTQFTQFEMVFWDTGTVEIPTIIIQILNKDSSLASTLNTEPLNIEIASILEKDSSLKSEGNHLRPIKKPVSVSIPWDLKKIGLIFILILILGGIILIWFTRQNTLKKEPDVNPVFLEEPDGVALRRLDELEKNKPWRTGDEKTIYVTLSQILREYVENSLYFRCMEMTTEEIMEIGGHLPFSKEEFDGFHGFLQRADLIKYANHIPDLSMCNQDIAFSREFVKKTIPYWKILQ